jgi:signal-transduction protein with cAMP-binding, CBS, and nucleotidyltransferase domain
MIDKSVADLMHEGVISCSLNTPLPEVARRMTEADVSAIVVVDDEGYLAGLISRTDLATLYGYDEMWPHLQAGQAMSGAVHTISRTNAATEAARRIHQHKVSRLIVTEPVTNSDKKRPVGVLSITDIVRAMSTY